MEPMKGVTLMKKFNNSDKHYRVSCDCSSPDHNHDLFVEKDGDTGLTTVTVYSNMNTGWVNRVKLAIKLLWSGYLEYQSEIILTQEQAENYANVLLSNMDEKK